MQTLTSYQQFHDVLTRAWRSGIPNEKDYDLIERARIDLDLSLEEADQIARAVRVESYITSIKVAWRQQRIIPTQPAAFDEFRQRFGITPEEHMNLEARLLWELQTQQKHETIFYIDDDIGLTEVIEETLKDAGYKTMIATSPEQAIQQLRNVVPDLILCDVRFPNSDLNGLSIYNTVRQMPQFTLVPFLFLSAVTDDNIVHAGLGAGADDYITKPFNPDTLLATIEGKLKRYRELKKGRS